MLGNFTRRRRVPPSASVGVASDEVVFPGAIYDPEVVSGAALPLPLYLHGHTVGGTNPSLVEAMAAGNAVIAHDNGYNRWVAVTARATSRMPRSLTKILDDLLTTADAAPRCASREPGAHRGRVHAGITSASQYERCPSESNAATRSSH